MRGSPTQSLGKTWRIALLGLALLVAACDPKGPGSGDGGDDAGVEGCGAMTFPELLFSHASHGALPGDRRELFVELSRNYCEAVEITLDASPSGLVTVPSTLRIEVGESRAPFAVEALAEGTVTITASATLPNGETQTQMRFDVVAAALPACDGEASGALGYGESLTVDSGSLAGAEIGLPAGAERDDLYHADPFEASIGCAADQVPEGYRALGPAVRFGPEALRFARELPLTIPIRVGLLPSGAHRGHIEVSYLGPGASAPRIVPITSPRFLGDAAEGHLAFYAPRLGTYQAVARERATRTREREFQFRGIMGFSMGGAGTSSVGFGNPELFDFVAPLGGPTDWVYLLSYLERYHVGGFCTEDQRAADPAGCAAGSSLERTPPSDELYEHQQHYEHWWFEDEYDTVGGVFDREEYVQIFRDLTHAFGNVNSDRSVDPREPNILPPGVPSERFGMSDSALCEPANQFVIPPCAGTAPSCAAGTGYLNGEYNPDGRYAVITFCDGAQQSPGGTLDVGLWDPGGRQYEPMEIALAVDIDGDGVRGPGEPVIRSGHEPWDDFGLDGLPSESEPGYDPVTNPDPSGDDYDFQYNPSGTEGNHRRDSVDGDPCTAGAEGVAEAFLDSGLDGVIGSLQLEAGGYDHGEGNGCFDRAEGALNMIRKSARVRIESMDPATLDDVDVIVDGGLRDLFNWVVMGNHTMGALAARGRTVTFFNEHAALQLDGRVGPGEYAYAETPWWELGRSLMVRYGNVDADPALRLAGDGQHVGTIEQLVNRFNAAVGMMSYRWPGGDRATVQDSVCSRVSETCPNPNSYTFEFTASDGRAGPVSVVLPPGYFAPENADLRYPVVYFLHGYGQEPQDLVGLGVFLWRDMIAARVPYARRLQKMIFVFPDGRCRGQECIRGTFYADAPDNHPNGAHMESFLLDLIGYVDANLRTRAPETHTVNE